MQTLGLALRDVTVAGCDTWIAPVDLGSCSRWVNLMGGHAVGARITELPITTERVVKALRENRGEG